MHATWTTATNVVVTVDAPLVSAAAAVVGALIALTAQVTVLTRRNRLRARLRHAMELQREVEEATGPEMVALQQSLDKVVKHCSSELATLESMWVRRVSTTGPVRRELVTSLAGVLTVAGLVGTLISWSANVSSDKAVIVGLALAVVLLVWILRFENALKRDIARAESGEVTMLRGRWLRFAVGIDESVLMACPTDAVRFTRLGMLLYLLPIATTMSLLTWPGAPPGGSVTVIIVGVLLVVVTFNINQSTAMHPRPSDGAGWFVVSLRTLMALVFGTMLAEPIVLRALGNPIDQLLAAKGVPHDHRDFFARVEALDALTTDDHRFLVAAWSIRLLAVVVVALPILIRVMGSRTSYDRALDQRRNLSSPV